MFCSSNRDGKQHIQNKANRDLEKEIVLNTSNRLEGKTRILHASDVLLSLAGRRITSDTGESSPAVENFQEALRLFPPFRDDDGTMLGALEVKCPDCDAVFSSSAELKQHYLTRYCPGAAIAVYVMTRDRLITKGYRMEKRLIPLDSRPIQFFCGSCENPFSLSHDGETIERQQNTECFADCTHCGSKCNILYKPVLNDPREETGYRDIQKEITSASQSRSPSIIQKSSMTSKFPMTDFNGEQSLAKKARRIRDSWSFRSILPSSGGWGALTCLELSQGDEEELLAISFAGLYDLERVHAPHGIYRPLDTNIETGLSDTSFGSSGLGDTIIEPDRTLCDESRHQASNLANSEGALIEDNRNAERNTPTSSRRQSFFQKLFGRKVPMGRDTAYRISRSRSTKGKKLLKRANTIRFSFVTKYSRSDSRAVVRDSIGSSEEALAQGEDESQNHSSAIVQDAEYVALLRGTQNIFVHMQYLSGGAIVHDASGRQRILQVDEVARLFLQMKDELSSTTAWSRVLMARVRAEAFLKQGNSQAAVGEFHDAMKMLDDTPGVDVEKQTRAAILHSMGQAYRGLDLPAESEACYLEALGFYKRVLGRDHPKNFAVLHDLGSLCEKDGYATEASALYERSFAGRLKTLGHNAPETLSSMQNLACLKVLLGDLESALSLLKKAVPALDTVFGIQNATTLNAMNKLSLLYQKLGLEKESRAICGRAIPHCRTVFGLDSPVTRDTVVRYLQSSDNFDFPPDIKDILDTYKHSQDPDCLRVIHRLGRSYMDAGLNRDAANIFETLVEDFLAVKGPEAPETFDALSALSVSREHLDSLDKAILSYRQLVQMAKRTPAHHHSRKRIGYAEKRISELDRRRELLESEKKEWRLNDARPCANCGVLTILLCSTCNITRFCSDTCHKQSTPTHSPQCIPSITLRASKSLVIKPKCPSSARDQALSKISLCDSKIPGQTSLDMNMNLKTIAVTATRTFYLDPRNFTTFRMMLSPSVNTVVLFSLDSDVQYTVVTTSTSHPPSKVVPVPVPVPSEAQSGGGGGGGKIGRISHPTTSSKKNIPTLIPPYSSHPQPQKGKGKEKEKEKEITWLTPQTQDSFTYIPSLSPSSTNKNKPEEKYLLIKPGNEMHRALIDKRINIRSGPVNTNTNTNGRTEKDLFTALEAPNQDLIEYAQGLLLTGYLGEVVMYVVEWGWK
ncbi:hypothetical protein BDW59DRAFT_171016 [Aspergillus cavernicola]|uniref:MYND-type domain-containing protein n=1 Tax=Aspergillus cavernicola TaxID=176166 RepID=A0ABR4IK72_9EURO